MDLNSLLPVERIIPILNPGTREELGVYVTVVSLQDERMKEVKRRIQNEKLRLESRGKTMKADDIEENGYELVFAAMVGWEWKNEITFDGEKPAFNKANVFKVLKKFPWFFDQLQEAISDESGFFQTSNVDSKKPSVSTVATK